MDLSNLNIKNLDHLGLVAGLCQEVGIAEIIDKLIPSSANDKIISTGKCLEAMILNGLGFTGRTLHMYSQYFEDKPIQRLLGIDIKAEQINDDALGRCLDKLFEYGVSELYQHLGEAVIKHLGLPCEAINIDTTSFHVDGEYSVDDDFTGIRLTKGYSRDHRPELNQVILNLITENQAGIPVYMKAHSGNKNDTETFKKLIKSHISSLKAAQKSRYWIGDSALYVAETIKAIHEQKQFFITRVPQKIVEVKELIYQLDTLHFEDLNDGYRAAFVESDYASVPQKWLVVYSQHANKKELISLEKRITKSIDASQKSFNKLCQQDFSCEADALKAIKRWENEQGFAALESFSIEKITKHKSRGRPALNAEGTISYQVNGTIICSSENRKNAEKNLGIFILATNDCSEHLDMQAMLDHYKSQQKVEGGFRFLKSPDFLVSSLFLKKPERIEALLMVMTCCLMVYAALEHLIRTSLKKTGTFFPDMKKKPCQNPTARWVFQCFQGIHVLDITQNNMNQIVVINLKERHQIILNAIGKPFMKIYS